MKGDLREIHNLCIQKNLTFATFRLPHQLESTTYIQTSPHSWQWSSIHDLPVKQGFIMAPFDTRNGKKYILVKPDIRFTGKKPEMKLSVRSQSYQRTPCPGGIQ